MLTDPPELYVVNNFCKFGPVIYNQALNPSELDTDQLSNRFSMKNIIALVFLSLAIIITGCNKDPFADADSGTFKDSRDSKSYQWVRIGDQIWMAGNLAWLPSVSPSSVISETSPYYYVNGYDGSSVSEAKATANYSTYGALYNWHAAQNACPSGWHLPTDSEWTILTNHLGGIDVAGMKMKSTSGWNSNGNGDNSSGFNALPAGGLDHKYGFITINTIAVFSSATENSTSTAWYRGLIFSENKVNRNDPVKSDGYSVRCIKD
jgi:uncharacterized protein (TIGR02145 family)